jgi:hypothetical protein
MASANDYGHCKAKCSQDKAATIRAIKTPFKPAYAADKYLRLLSIIVMATASLHKILVSSEDSGSRTA